MTPGPAKRPTRRRAPDDGSVTVFVADEQHVHPVEVERWTTLADRVLEAEGVRGDAELSVLFVDERTIGELNERFMDASGPTDVLSFPIDGDLAEPGRYPDSGGAGPDRLPADPDDLPLLLGDVVICPAVAHRQAPEHAGSYDDEIALLIVHGILHLLGRDHADESGRADMQARERELLGLFHGVPARDPWAS